MIIIALYVLMIAFNVIYIWRLIKLRKQLKNHYFIVMGEFWPLVVCGHAISVLTLYTAMKEEYTSVLFMVGVIVGAFFIFAFFGISVWLSNLIYIYDWTGFWFGISILLHKKYLYTELTGQYQEEKEKILFIGDFLLTLSINSKNNVFFDFALHEYEKSSGKKLQECKKIGTIDIIQGKLGELREFLWNMLLGSFIFLGILVSVIYMYLTNYRDDTLIFLWIAIIMNIMWFAYAIRFIYEVKNYDKYDEKRQKEIEKKLGKIRTKYR